LKPVAGSIAEVPPAYPSEPKPSPRKHHTAAIFGQDLFLIGGVTDNDLFLSDIWAFDLGTPRPD
jgi:hypothetical protein